jgi:ATP-dependent Clp protease protease subunit
MKRKYFAVEKHKQTATITIYGDITSYPWFEGDVSSANLSKQLEEMNDVDEINVYINSYGGEVKEGIAIYNALRRHKAKVRTICDGFACSIASVIFMAGDERVMNEASMLMIHNAWTYVEGNAAELRKHAEDLEKITQLSIEAYKANSFLKEEEIKAFMDAETWILPNEAVENGFATSVEKTEKANYSQNAKEKLLAIVRAYQKNQEPDEESDDTPDDDDQDDPEKDPDNPPDDDSNDDPDKDEPKDDDPEEPADDEEDDSDADKEKEAAQMWSGFFNALKKM